MEGAPKNETAPAEITFWAKMMVADLKSDINHLYENGSFEFLPREPFLQATNPTLLKEALEKELHIAIPEEGFVVTILTNPENPSEKAFRITKIIDTVV